MFSSWDAECPVCGEGYWGDGELFDEEVECPHCHSRLKVSTQATWEVYAEVIEERHETRGDEEESEDEFGREE